MWDLELIELTGLGHQSNVGHEEAVQGKFQVSGEDGWYFSETGNTAGGPILWRKEKLSWGHVEVRVWMTYRTKLLCRHSIPGIWCSGDGLRPETQTWKLPPQIIKLLHRSGYPASTWRANERGRGPTSEHCQRQTFKEGEELSPEETKKE